MKRERVVRDEVTCLPPNGTKCTEAEGRTRQEAADACDINRMVDRMAQGVVPGLNDRVPQYLDLTKVGSLHESLERVRAAEAAFASLPARVRSAFENSMVKFTDAFQSEEGIAQLRELGVVAETEETLADRREAAAEARAVARAEARAVAARVAAAKLPPVAAAKLPPG